MVYAYILVNVETGKGLEVLEALKKTNPLKRVSLTYGSYDLCIEVECNTMEDLDDYVFNVVRKIPGLQRTTTLVAAKTVSKES